MSRYPVYVCARRLAAVLGLVIAATLLSACQSCSMRTFNRITLAQPDPTLEAVSGLAGALEIRNQAGFNIELYACGVGGQDLGGLCMQIVLPEGHRFRFLETQTTVTGIAGRPPVRSPLSPIA